ncbi:putative endo-polygalacturonase [Helianthus annuus]|nr:putative endo-polygalacturonase [Helianthus annuus]
MFTGDSGSVVELDGEFTSIDQVVIDQNNAIGGMRMKSTVGKLAVTGSRTVWMADFSQVLVFPDRISHVQYSVYNSALRINGMGGHAVTNVSGNVVVVETEKQMNGTVWFLVDQNL